MSSNALYQSLGAIGFLSRFPITRIVPRFRGVEAPIQSLEMRTPPAVHRPGVIGDPKAQQIVSKHQRVGIGNFVLDSQTPGFISSNDTQCTNLQISLGDSNAVGLPIFFLPYKDNMNFRITLVEKETMNASIFTTDLIDGCSIYVEGTRKEPTVYHINAKETHAKFYRPNASRKHIEKADRLSKSQQMDRRFLTDANKTSGPSGGARAPKRVRQPDPLLIHPGKLEAKDYMIFQSGIWDFEDSLPQLQQSLRAPTILGGQTINRWNLLETCGACFGIKNPAGEWTFYAQRKAAVEYFSDAPDGSDSVSLGLQWIVRDVVEFWPTARIGTQFSALRTLVS